MREIIIDTETTGLDYSAGDRIIEVGCVELINHVPTGDNLQFYCSTNKAVSQEAYEISGLNNDFLNSFPGFAEQANKFLEFIKNDTLVIHNADFDIGFINNELSIIGINKLTNKVIDTVALARKTLNIRIANLDYLCKRLSVDLSARTLHGALLDCQLLAEIYLELRGGRQTSLELDKTPDLKPKNKTFNQKKPNNITKVEITKEDIQAHKNFVADLKNALWHKVNY